MRSANVRRVLRQWLSPPRFDNDEQAQAASLLNTILWAALVITMLTSVIPLFLTNPIPVISLVIIAVAVVMEVMSLVLLHRRHVRLASAILSSMGMLIITGAVYFFGGLRDPSFNAYVLIILVGGLLLGGRAAALLAVGGILAGLVMLMAETAGRLPVPNYEVTSAQRWYTGALIFCLAAVLLGLALQSIRNALAKARANEQAQLEANRELQAIRESLEERVRLRTKELSDSHVQLEQAYRSLQENQQRLLISEKMASLGRLTAGIAHEMNTPIAAVRSSLAQLQALVDEYRTSAGDADVSPDDHKQIAAEMRRAIDIGSLAAERSASFVRGVRAQTRDLDREPALAFEVAPVLQDALMLLSHSLRAAGCRLEVVTDQASGLRLFGSPGRFAQVITNLVTNSIDASAPKGGGLITVRLTGVDGGLSLSVEDQGVGIAPENLARVFDPMFTTKPFGQGTGLGMTIVHDIVTSELSGTIEIHSELGTGTKVDLTLPLPREVEHAA